jgi:hypothetical protein
MKAAITRNSLIVIILKWSVDFSCLRLFYVTSKFIIWKLSGLYEGYSESNLQLAVKKTSNGKKKCIIYKICLYT